MYPLTRYSVLTDYTACSAVDPPAGAPVDYFYCESFAPSQMYTISFCFFSRCYTFEIREYVRI